MRSVITANAPQDHLAEFGIVAPVGRKCLLLSRMLVTKGARAPIPSLSQEEGQSTRNFSAAFAPYLHLGHGEGPQSGPVHPGGGGGGGGGGGTAEGVAGSTNISLT